MSYLTSKYHMSPFPHSLTSFVSFFFSFNKSPLKRGRHDRMREKTKGILLYPSLLIGVFLSFFLSQVGRPRRWPRWLCSQQCVAPTCPCTAPQRTCFRLRYLRALRQLLAVRDCAHAIILKKLAINVHFLFTHAGSAKESRSNNSNPLFTNDLSAGGEFSDQPAPPPPSMGVLTSNVRVFPFAFFTSIIA